jgi:hypothetical protein
MTRTHLQEKMETCFKTYTQLYENPFSPQTEIAEEANINRGTVSRTIVKGDPFLYDPVICLKPAQNYHEYVYFLEVEDPMQFFEQVKEFPFVTYATLNFGAWTLFFICNKYIDCSILKGYQNCMHRAIKSVTHFSQVKTLTWDESIKKMHDALNHPVEKTFLYEEIPSIPWKNREWDLYQIFKNNVRIRASPVLKKLGISRIMYYNWYSTLSRVAKIQPAFYPLGIEKYHIADFLFKSQYQKQITDILGMLPSTSQFFSVGGYLLARLFYSNKKEMDDLYMLIYKMGVKGFFTDFCHAMVVKTSGELIL